MVLDKRVLWISSQEMSDRFGQIDRERSEAET
jgi:hypothetical protein